MVRTCPYDFCNCEIYDDEMTSCPYCGCHLPEVPVMTVDEFLGSLSSPTRRIVKLDQFMRGRS